MLVLLPPSETKRDGGDGPPVGDVALRHPELAGARETVAAALVALARDGDGSAMMTALKLGPRLAPEIARNRMLAESATMPALDRYTGVLYDALDAPSLPVEAREFAAEHVRVHSALFGLVGGLDPIPAYRLSHDSRLPALKLKSHWRSRIAAELAAHDGLVLDLRSEGYSELGPAPVRDGSVFVRVVTRGADGRKRALNHFNKQGKGRFARALLESRVAHADLDALIAWAAEAGFELARSDERGPGGVAVVELVV
ncbi:peroxide stress protein YaaA [Agromyces seonyuensis]|uniref:Peroxide stress protein YaaA n=1 Tax=Agromyces seonyuensis TaxID=2662446 RepID=A0A6I4P177_9MICO|nr:peroxide stress protein YaaA [Agromyces seonyuensis]